ncbi:MAG: hypothetical protein EBZ13_09695 [Planctomycetia bacterium]|nr:hypothetical protein [Planctomycetia bacterium]
MFRDGRRHLCRQLGVRLSIGPTLTRLTLGSRLRKSCESTNDGAHLERLGEKKQPMKRTGSNAFVALAVVLVVNLTAQARPTGDHVLLVGIDDLNDWIGCLSDRDAPAKGGHLTGRGQPRFLGLGFYNPHLPLFAPQKLFDAVPSMKDVLLHARYDGDMDDLSPIAKRIASRVSFQAAADWSRSSQKNLRILTQAHLACTSAMDGALGEVIDALDKSDMADSTWIIVLSDHGWHLGEKNHVAKQTLWTRSTRVPMIIVPPRRMTKTPCGVRCDRPVVLLDVYPTLLAGTNLEPIDADQQLDGLSLLPWLGKNELARCWVSRSECSSWLFAPKAPCGQPSS